MSGLKVFDQYLASSSSDCVKIWNIETGKWLRTIEIASITCIDKLSNNLMVTGSWFGEIKIWNIHSGECLHSFKTDQNGLRRLAINEMNEIALIYDQKCNIQIWSNI